MTLDAFVLRIISGRTFLGAPEIVVDVFSPEGSSVPIAERHLPFDAHASQVVALADERQIKIAIPSHPGTFAVTAFDAAHPNDRAVRTFRPKHRSSPEEDTQASTPFARTTVVDDGTTTFGLIDGIVFAYSDADRSIPPLLVARGVMAITGIGLARGLMLADADGVALIAVLGARVTRRSVPMRARRPALPTVSRARFVWDRSRRVHVERRSYRS